MNDYNELLLKSISMFDKYNNICLTSHVNPDGDSIGSVLALGLALKENSNKNIIMFIPDEIPKNLFFLPGIKLLKKEVNEEKIDLLIALDCGDQSRLGDSQGLSSFTGKIINIDHHKTNTNFGDINILNYNSSSTGEIVYQLLECMKSEINTDVATCLYTAISTDTGSFKYDNTTSNTHKIASKLIDKGIDLNLININLYESRSIEKTSLLMKSLNTLEFFESSKVAIVIVTKEMLMESKATINDTDSIIEFIRDIDTVEVACILKEVDDSTIKIGFRSKTNVDVSKIASIFGGGGHSKASGCTILGNIYEIKKLIIDEINKALR